MGFFDEQQFDTLRIEQMVFHLVGPKADQFVRLEAIDPGRFANFFLERIGSVNSGTPYEFTDASSTRERLSRIAANPSCFQIETEKLAEDFQREHAGAASAGAFLVFQLKAGAEEFFALLKYDDEMVLTYDMQDIGNGRKRVNLDSVERTFVQNRDALQKSAIVRLTETGGYLRVLDRRNQQKVARYFENFLQAKPVHGDAELTEKLVSVVKKLIRENKDLVSPAVYSENHRRCYQAAVAGGRLDVDDQKRFLEMVVGHPLADENPLVKKFRSALKRERIENAPITLNPERIRQPNMTQYITTNNIRIRVPNDMRRAIEIQDARIIINDKVENTYDDTEEHT